MSATVWRGHDVWGRPLLAHCVYNTHANTYYNEDSRTSPNTTLPMLKKISFKVDGNYRKGCKNDEYKGLLSVIQQCYFNWMLVSFVILLGLSLFVPDKGTIINYYFRLCYHYFYSCQTEVQSVITYYKQANKIDTDTTTKSTVTEKVQ